MKYFKYLFIVIFTLFTTGCSTKELNISNKNNFSLTSELYNSMINANEVDIAKLNLFFTNMPKGGDLHHHYSGSIYAETYLDWVEEKGWFIDSCTFTIVRDKREDRCNVLTVAQLKSDPVLYRKLLMLWSDRDFYNHSHEQVAPDINFFNTFGYFGNISSTHLKSGLKILKQRAINENVSYIESMFTRTGIKSKNFFSKQKRDELNQLLWAAKSQKKLDFLLDKITDTCLKNKRFNKEIDTFINNTKEFHRDIDSDEFMMKFQIYAVRLFPPLQVFLDLLSGYVSVEKSPLFVGVNMVGPENSERALQDYTLHMRMYNYLLRKYPNVHRSLHAGELTLGMVRPKNLNFHIGEAIDIAKAQRIGHGIDLPYEHNVLKLLKKMKKRSAIEINLSSNEFILGVKGNAHPYKIYSSYGVPIIISTDDSGVSRGNLSHEYVLLASRYKPSYSKIKEYVYNSIKYSFLSEKEKMIIQKRVDKKFEIFEKNMANFKEDMK
jgi:adenosine deaminase/adenosine deaminase CECR1